MIGTPAALRDATAAFRGRGNESNLRQATKNHPRILALLISFAQRSVACAAHVRKISNLQVAGGRAYEELQRQSQPLWPEPIVGDSAFKTLDEIDFLASPGKDACQRTHVCE